MLHKTEMFTVEEILEAQAQAATSNSSFEQVLEANRGVRDAQAYALRKLKMLDGRTMSKKDRIAATMQMPELHDNLYEELQDNGFRTGSMVYTRIEKPNDEDWCICIAPSAFSEFTIGQGDQGYWEADGFSSVYAHKNGMLLNILCFSDVRLMYAWKFATETLTHLLVRDYDIETTNWSADNMRIEDVLAVKWKRVRLFNALRDIVYDPSYKKVMDLNKAWEHNMCRECSREALFFTCKAARDHYKETGVCERCSGLTY